MLPLVGLGLLLLSLMPTLGTIRIIIIALALLIIALSLLDEFVVAKK
jgi:uncharacterized SAM-binding protein YcdF (DUF218 family)